VPYYGSAQGTPAPTLSGQTGGQGSNPTVGLYLIKTLEADMQVPDPRRAADDLRQHIQATDPRAQSAGLNVQQQGDGTYTVQMVFSVQATLYTQIEVYLAEYAPDHQGKLLRLQETVQDVTGDYVDSQSRLTNLRSEQQRLLNLMAHATSLSDILAIDQRLTDIEGQIEQIEGHLNELAGQTSFYTITINLSPPPSGPGSPAPTPWQPGQTLRDALSMAGHFGEWLINVLIWLAVFGLYAVPVGGIAWLVRKRLRVSKP
jgi:hypothetical protein